MVHGIGWTAFATSALLIREAARLVQCQLAYRQQQWLVNNARQVTSAGQSIEITGLNRITIARGPDQPA